MILLFIILSVIYEPFNYQQAQPEQLYTLTTQQSMDIYQPAPEPYNAPIDWENLDYDDPTWGWLYKLLWYANHDSSETPPWQYPKQSLEEDIPWIFMLIMSGLYAYVRKKCECSCKKEEMSIN